MEHEPSPAPVAAYVALGANLDDPAAQVRAGLRALAALPETRLVRRSSLYRSPPEGGAEQPDYVNAVAALETRLAPRALLERLLEIEREHGRVRSARNAPRRLDLDLLLYGALELEEPDLAIPHPRMHRRAFVLVPLAEIAPEARVPGHGRAAELAQSVDASGLVRLEEASGADEDARAGAGT